MARDVHGVAACAQMFADWLVSTFGKEYLCSGSGALDIAGGHGDVSRYSV